MVNKEHDPVKAGRYSNRGYYDQRFIRQVVKEVEEGLPRKAAMINYGLKEGTLDSWMKKFGSAAYKKRRKLPVAGSVKRSVVRALTEGRLSIQEAQLAYGIKAARTIKQWIKQLDQENVELSGITSSMAESNKQHPSSSQDLQAAHEALKKQLAEAQLKIAALNTLIDVAEEQLKINIRKKPGAKQS